MLSLKMFNGFSKSVTISVRGGNFEVVDEDGDRVDSLESTLNGLDEPPAFDLMQTLVCVKG